MLRLDVNGSVWGLVELYRAARTPFTAEEVQRATELVRLT
jgi:hypothetical protein